MAGELLSSEYGMERQRGEECGVFGIYAPGKDVAQLTYFGLQALQHRGQQGAGIVVQDKESGRLTGVKGSGKAEMALRQGKDIIGLPESYFATGHVRYGTHYKNGLSEEEKRQMEYRAVQPMISQSGENEETFTVSHNGHIANFDESAVLVKANCVTDSELIMRLIEREQQLVAGNIELRDAVSSAVKNLVGAYSLVIMGDSKLIGLRDPRGFRPLWLGSLPDGGSVLASEVAGIQIAGGKLEREVLPGELVEIGLAGTAFFNPFAENEVTPKLCLHEFTYFSRPDQVMYGENVEEVRFKSGELLALSSPVDADIVVPSPNSGRAAAEGFANASGLPQREGLVRNTYIDRTFITGSQLSREEKVRLKLSPNEAIISGKRLVVVDDSIIRGTTTREIVTMLKNAGAEQVHLRIASPPYEWPCFYGMDTPSRKELIAAFKDEEQVREELGADSLAYLSLGDLKIALGNAGDKICDACVTGNYPTPVPLIP